jgi:hypothetical protein
MTHEKLLAIILNPTDEQDLWSMQSALRAVVELHKPSYYPDKIDEAWCNQCAEGRGYAKYPCPTIQAIEKELK